MLRISRGAPGKVPGPLTRGSATVSATRRQTAVEQSCTYITDSPASAVVCFNHG